MRSTPILLILGLFICAAAFVATISGAFRPHGTPVAQLTEANGTVFRLLKGEFTWDRTFRGSVFAMGDTISTGDHVEARIRFDAGGELYLSPGSTVVIKGTPDQLELSILSGSGLAFIEKGSQSKWRLNDSKGIQTNLVDRLGMDGTAGIPGAHSLLKEWLGHDPRLIGGIRNPERPLAGNPIGAAGGELPVPVVLTPENHAVVDFANVSALPMNWSVSSSRIGATHAPKKFEIVLTPVMGRGEPLKFIALDKQYSLKPIPIGEYSFSIRAVSEDGHRGAASKTRWFRVMAVPAPKPEVRKPAARVIKPKPVPKIEEPKVPQKPRILPPKIKYDSAE